MTHILTFTKVPHTKWRRSELGTGTGNHEIMLIWPAGLAGLLHCECTAFWSGDWGRMTLQLFGFGITYIRRLYVLEPESQCNSPEECSAT